MNTALTFRQRLAVLGGEPVAVVAAISTALYMADSFGWLSGIGIHGQDSVAILVVVLNAAGGLYNAIRTHHTILAPVIAVFTALVNLGVIYGLHISTEQTGLVVTFITAIFAMFHRTQTSPEPPAPGPAPAPVGHADVALAGIVALLLTGIGVAALGIWWEVIPALQGRL